MRIAEYFHESQPPPVRGLDMIVYAIVRDARAPVLPVRRMNASDWELAGRLAVRTCCSSGLGR